MIRLIGVLVLVLGLTGAAFAQMGQRGVIFGFIGGGSSPPQTGDILLADGSSLLLQTDGASFVCLAGGC